MAQKGFEQEWVGTYSTGGTSTYTCGTDFAANPFKEPIKKTLNWKQQLRKEVSDYLKINLN